MNTRIVFLLILCCLSGCNSDSTVSGSVTLDGVPLDKGTIQFAPDSGNAEFTPVGTTIQNGKYRVSGPPSIPTGTYTVRISSLSDKTVTGEPILPPGPGAPIKPVVAANRIPPEWNKESQHKIEVKKGTNTFDFKITAANPEP